MGLLPSDLFSVVSTSTTLDIDLSSLSTGTATASPSLATIGSTRQANSLTSPKDSKLSATLYDLAATSATAAPTSFIVIDAFAENGDAEVLLEDLRGLGLIEGTSFLNVVSGLLPVSALSSLEGVESLSSVRESLVQLNVGSVTTQADASIRSDEARAQFGVDGSGLSIGILSDSFNALGGQAADVASGDLPANVTILSDVPSGFDGPMGDEGRAIAQIIHDIAPGADLLFHTAVLGIADFAQGIIDLANAGADIIIDDVVFFAETFFQDGIIAQAVDIVTAQGVLFFSSAGNSGTDSYQSIFNNSGIFEPGTLGGIAHDFDAGADVDTRQLISLPDEGVIQLTFQYDESSRSATNGLAGPDSDYDIFLFEAGTNNIVAQSSTSNANEPVEIYEFTNETGSTQQYEIVITRFDGSRDALLQYIDLSGDATILEFDTNSPTVFGHSNAAGAIAVGAAAFFNTPEFGAGGAFLNGFSSVGGIPILLDTQGNRLATPEDRGGPLFTAADGGNTTFFGTDVGFDSDSFPNFFGTSASAPAAAAAAALLLEAVPTATREQIIQAFNDTAIDIGTPGFDLASGAGLIQVDAALAALQNSTTPPPPPPPAGPTSGNDTLNGTDGDDLIDALGGDDVVFGGIGNDSLIGNTGRDNLSGDAGNDLLDGGGGTDTLNGGDGQDTLLGGSGPDELSGGDGNDSLDGGTNNDTILAGSGDDTILGRSGADIVDAGLGNDFIETGGGFDTVLGGEGNDTIDTAIGADSIEGGDGDDNISTGTNLDTINGGAGNDTITALSGADLIDGGTGNDSISSGAGFDTIFGGTGADVIFGGIGPDTIDGGDDNDFLDGGTNLDTISGGNGDDTINGASGADILDGQSGNDLIDASGGFDTISGGDGADTISGGIGADSISGGNDDDDIDAGSNTDTIDGGSGNDTIDGGSAGDLIDGGEGNDVIDAGSGFDTVTSGLGDDSIFGGLGNDSLISTAGNDTLDGGLGNDTLIGGSGDNVFEPGILGGDSDVLIFADDFGNDIINSFDLASAGSGQNDLIDLSAVTEITDFADLVDNHLSQALDGSAIISVGTDTIEFVTALATDLTEDDFIF